jgi:hypothetical protein
VRPNHFVFVFQFVIRIHDFAARDNRKHSAAYHPHYGKLLTSLLPIVFTWLLPPMTAVEPTSNGAPEAGKRGTHKQSCKDMLPHERQYRLQW